MSIVSSLPCPLLSSGLRSPFSVSVIPSARQVSLSACSPSAVSHGLLSPAPLGRRVPQSSIRTPHTVGRRPSPCPCPRGLLFYCVVSRWLPLPLPSPHLSLHLRNSSIVIAVGRRRATIKRGSASSASGPTVGGQPAGNANTFLCGGGGGGQQQATHSTSHPLASCNRVSWSEDPPPALPESESLKWSIVTRTNNGEE